jgi:hypothetical protein
MFVEEPEQLVFFSKDTDTKSQGTGGMELWQLSPLTYVMWNKRTIPTEHAKAATLQLFY